MHVAIDEASSDSSRRSATHRAGAAYSIPKFDRRRYARRRAPTAARSGETTVTLEMTRPEGGRYVAGEKGKSRARRCGPTDPSIHNGYRSYCRSRSDAWEQASSNGRAKRAPSPHAYPHGDCRNKVYPFCGITSIHGKLQSAQERCGRQVATRTCESRMSAMGGTLVS